MPTTIEEFSEKFKTFIWSDQLLLLLPGCGWNDGGCRSLMQGLRLWLNSDKVHTYQIVKKEEQLHSEHALIKIGQWFIDGDGVSHYDQLKNRWLYEEGLPNVIIRKFTPETEPDHINGEEPFYIDKNAMDKLVCMLESYFNKEEIMELLLYTKVDAKI